MSAGAKGVAREAVAAGLARVVAALKDYRASLDTLMPLREQELAGAINLHSEHGDRDINDVFLRVVASAESDSHRAALALTRQQRDFIEKRNTSSRGLWSS